MPRRILINNSVLAAHVFQEALGATKLALRPRNEPEGMIEAQRVLELVRAVRLRAVYEGVDIRVVGRKDENGRYWISRMPRILPAQYSHALINLKKAPKFS